MMILGALLTHLNCKIKKPSHEENLNSYFKETLFTHRTGWEWMEHQTTCYHYRQKSKLAIIQGVDSSGKVK